MILQFGELLIQREEWGKNWGKERGGEKQR